MPGWFINTGVIFAQAVAAAERIPSEVGDRTGGQMDAITAAILSATALEGFVNELAELASASAPLEKDHQRLITLGEVLDGLEQSRASIDAKFWVAKWILSGTNYDKGQKPYQDLKTLIGLRNAILHLKSDPLEVEKGHELDNTPSTPSKKPPCVRVLVTKGVASDFRGVHASWVSLVSTRAVARWSCHTAAAMAQSILEHFDKNSRIRLIFAPAFEVIHLSPTAAAPAS